MEEYKKIKIIYKNWRGETSERELIPINLIFESNEWHPEPQWLMEAYDLNKNKKRKFAIKDIIKYL